MAQTEAQGERGTRVIIYSRREASAAACCTKAVILDFSCSSSSHLPSSCFSIHLPSPTHSQTISFSNKALHIMGGTGKGDASIQAFFPPTPQASPVKTAASPASGAPLGDGFTAEEVRDALQPKPVEPWHPSIEYTECDIRDLNPGPRPVMFMGRVANIFDVSTSSKSPRAAKGCLKLTVKDNTGAVTVRPHRPMPVGSVDLSPSGPPLVC